jgi:GTPase Era involved in 16S rRNA processing
MSESSGTTTNLSKLTTDSPLCVVVGNTGAGKTKLCNMICGTNHKACAGRNSITRNLYENPVNCGLYPFAVVDTPGINSQVDAFKHAFLLKEALTGTPINAIFFVIKYDARFDNMLLDYAKLLSQVEKYSYKIVAMFSHMDQSKNPKDDDKEIVELFSEEYSGFSKFIFYSEKDDPSKIADNMHSYASDMPKETLQISDEKFNLRFNIYEMRARIKVEYDKFLSETKQIEEDYTSLIEEAEKTKLVEQERDEFLHMCIISFKNELESLTVEFIKNYGVDMQEIESYGFHVMMQKQKIKLSNEFTEHVSVMMSYSLLDSCDPRNLIKRCPRCQEIWFKVEGCPGMTHCGNRPIEKLYDALATPWRRFIFKRFGRKIQWERVKMDTISRNVEALNLGEVIHTQTAEDVVEEIAEPVAQEIAEPVALEIREPVFEDNDEIVVGKIGGGVGCGKRFRWQDQPPIEVEKIRELFHVNTIEEVKEIIRRTDYAQMRQQYSNNIDKTRHA